MRSTLSKNGGALGETNSVGFMFDHVGEISYPAKAGSADKVMEAAIEAGADDVESDEEGHWIYTSFEGMGEVAAALEKALGEAESVKAIWRPQNNVPVDGEKGATLMRVIGLLEDDDDVQNVYANFEMSDEDMAKLEARPTRRPGMEQGTARKPSATACSPSSSRSWCSSCTRRTRRRSSALLETGRPFFAYVLSFMLHRHLLEQSSPPVPVGRAREWRMLWANNFLLFCAVAGAVYHRLDGREPTSRCGRPWSMALVCCSPAWRSSSWRTADQAARTGLGAEPRGRRRLQGMAVADPLHSASAGRSSTPISALASTLSVAAMWLIPDRRIERQISGEH